MWMGLYITISLLVVYIAFEIALRVLNRFGMPAEVGGSRRFIRVFVRAGYPGAKLYFKHKETGRVIKLVKPIEPFHYNGEVSVELTVVVPPAYRPDQVDRVWGILQHYELHAEVVWPGELLARCPVDEDLLAGLVRSILTQGFGLGFGAQLRVLQFGPLSLKESLKCDR
jgi:hypothetical protein